MRPIHLVPLLLPWLVACSAIRADPASRPAPAPMAQAAATHVPDAEPAPESAGWWYGRGARTAAGHGAMQADARNVIVFVGDGMSLATVTAARILEGQRRGGSGEEHNLAWEGFPHTALARTYSIDAQTPDSAATMTAIATGVKTRTGVVAVGPGPLRGDCAGARAAPLLTLLELAKSAGLATGVVTTTRITHATPAATYAHSANRDWEDDAELPQAAAGQGCMDIARQLVERPAAAMPDVVFGGGRMHFMTTNQRDPGDATQRGLRRDGRDLVAQWRTQHPDGAYVWNRGQLAAVDGPGPILGLFAPDHLHYEHDRQARSAEPSLAELTAAAIARLQRRPAGYVLVVEAGRIDHAHHAGNAHRALTDTIALSEAVQVAIDATSSADTTVLVTADHSHTLTFAGYPRRGNPILGTVRGSSHEEAGGRLAVDALGLPYTTLVYANGPGHTAASASQPAGPKWFPHLGRGYTAGGGRPQLGQVDTAHPDYLQEAIVPMSTETHGGDDVGVWASGPGAPAVRGSIEQNVIFHLLVQSTPALRDRLCRQGLCDGDGVPVRMPRLDDFPAR